MIQPLEESPHPQLTDQPLWTGARGRGRPCRAHHTLLFSGKPMGFYSNIMLYHVISHKLVGVNPLKLMLLSDTYLTKIRWKIGAGSDFPFHVSMFNTTFLTSGPVAPMALDEARRDGGDRIYPWLIMLYPALSNYVMHIYIHIRIYIYTRIYITYILYLILCYYISSFHHTWATGFLHGGDSEASTSSLPLILHPSGSAVHSDSLFLYRLVWCRWKFVHRSRSVWESLSQML